MWRQRQLPGSVALAMILLVAVVVVSAVTTVLTWLLHKQLVISWASRNDTAAQILAEGGYEALRNDPIVPAFVPLAVVSFIVFVLCAFVLAAFLLDGHGWARPVLTATVVFASLVAILSLGRHLPLVFVLLAWLSLAIDVALLAALWHKGTTAYLRRG